MSHYVKLVSRLLARMTSESSTMVNALKDFVAEAFEMQRIFLLELLRAFPSKYSYTLVQLLISLFPETVVQWAPPVANRKFQHSSLLSDMEHCSLVAFRR